MALVGAGLLTSLAQRYPRTVPDVTNVQVVYVTAAHDEVHAPLSNTDARHVLKGVPVREFPAYQGRRNYSGHFWSATNRDHVVYESLLELSWLWIADFDPSVTRIAAQPMRWQGMDADRVRVRIPDFMCQVRHDTVRVVDVKPASMLARPEVVESLGWTRDVCAARGWDYEVWSGTTPTVLRNIHWIAAARQPHVLDQLEVSETSAAAGEGITFGDLERSRRKAGRRAPRLEVLGALWAGTIRCDLTVPLSAESWMEPRSA